MTGYQCQCASIVQIQVVALILLIKFCAAAEEAEERRDEMEAESRVGPERGDGAGGRARREELH